MKQKISKQIRLLPYGIKFRGNLVMLVVFLVLGTGMELLWMLPGDTSSWNLGAIFLLCAAMFPPQLLLSLTASDYAKSAPDKRRFQTDAFVKLTFTGMLVMLVWIFLVALLGCALTGASMEEQTLPLLATGIFAFCVIVYSGVCYKYFVASVIVLYVVIFGFSFSYCFYWSSWTEGMKVVFSSVSLHPLLVFLIDVALMVLASLICYGLTCLLYRRELSKYAFGAGMRQK